MKHIYSFNDYSKDINIITEHLKGLYRDIHIVALYRGGLPLGVALSNRTNSPLSILNYYQRYDGKSNLLGTFYGRFNGCFTSFNMRL